MIDHESVRQIQQASVPERLHIIELILESLKHDVKLVRTIERPPCKEFTIRQFSLGREVHADRDQIYAERST